MEKFSSLTLASLFLVLLALGLYFWQVPWQSQDGPNHRQVALTLERLDTSPFEQSVYENNLGIFKTNSLFPMVYTWVSDWLSIEAYEKIFVAFFLILLLVSYFLLLSQWAPESLSLWVFALPILFHPLFCQGMYNFLASVPLTLLGMILLKRIWLRWKWGELILFLAICWLAFLAHPFSFVILPMVWVLLLLQNDSKNLAKGIGAGVPILIFALAGFILPFFLGRDAVSQGYLFKPPWELAAGLFWYNFPLFSYWQALIYLPLFLIFIYLMYASLKDVPWRYKIFWLVFLLAYFIFPNEEASGGAHLNNRFLIYMWLFLPLGIKPSLAGFKTLRVVTVCSPLLLATLVYRGMAKIETEVQQAQEVLQSLPQFSKLYPINFQAHGPALNYSSLLHIWANYPQDKGVFSPYLFARHHLMPLNRQMAANENYFPATPEDWPEQLAQGPICSRGNSPESEACRKAKYPEILQQAQFYDYWYLYQPPKDFLDVLASLDGLEQVKSSGRSSLWYYGHAKKFSPPLKEGVEYD